MPLDIESISSKLGGKRGGKKEGRKDRSEKREKKEKLQGRRQTEEKRVKNVLEDLKLPELELDSLSYSCMKREKMEKISVCTLAKVVPKTDKGSSEFSAEDHRLGSLENNALCTSCGKTNDECPGHYGIINLPQKYIHPLFREQMIRTLQCFCFRCYQPLLDRDIIKTVPLKGYHRLMHIADESEKLSHNGACEHVNHNYVYTDNPKFTISTAPKRSGGRIVSVVSSAKKDSVHINAYIDTGEKDENGKKILEPYIITPDMVNNLLSNISDEDFRLVGFEGHYEGGVWKWYNHPLNFLVDFIPVIPHSARPYVVLKGVKNPDFITKFYDDIITAKNSYNTSTGDRETYVNNMLFYYSHIIDNADKAYKKGAKDVVKSIKERLVGKSELIRGSLMGKRSDYTGRTVLGPNGGLEFGELAPPSIMRGQLTVPEHVTKYNIDFIKELAAIDEIKCLIPRYGKLAGRKLKFKKDKHEIKIGDTVERFSRDGDAIIFNRQPTLQKQSMCGYKCKFQNKLSVGLHITSTTGHNADFDGDEGNMHMLQTSQAQGEASSFMSGPSCIMSGINSAPVGGIIFNGATGGYLLSADDVVLTKQEYEDGVASTKYAKENEIYDRLAEINNIHGYRLNGYGGKALCSILFPPDFWYSNGKTKIRNGILVEGRLSKKNMGPSPNSIVQSLYKNYGVETTRRFITDATFLFNWYLGIYGFTVGVKDCRPPKNLEEEFTLRKRQIIEEINEEVLSFPPLPKDATELDKVQREAKINEVITTGTDRIKMALVGGETVENGKKVKIPRILAADNAISTMADSGAKGKVNDTAKIIALLGQQYVPDRRPDLVMNRGKRWLSSFHVDDKSIYSRGFVSRSFYEGLDPDEFFAHSMASRIGLCSTAIKTADIGALQRRMVKSQEDLVVQYDGSVRNQNGNIFQFTYGAGFGSSKMLRRTKPDGTDYLTFINLEETVGKINAESGFMTENYVFDSIRKMFE